MGVLKFFKIFVLNFCHGGPKKLLDPCAKKCCPGRLGRKRGQKCFFNIWSKGGEGEGYGGIGHRLRKSIGYRSQR